MRPGLWNPRAPDPFTNRRSIIDIPVIVVTGGPCGGKSTLMARVRERLDAFGIHVLVISETATELINAGATPAVLGTDAFQERLLLYSLEREKQYRDIAAGLTGHQVVILCDRGVLDCAAYMGDEPYRSMLRRLGYTQSALMHRYDLVVHLVTAASGAEEFYTIENNSARTETPEQARELDSKTITAWLGHSHHIIVDNRTDFADKMNRALRAFSRKLNMPAATEIERKWLVKNFTPAMIPQGAVGSRIIQDYLVCEGPGERRVRMRVREGGEASYYYTEKLPTGESGTRIEKERIISREQYHEYLAGRDWNLVTIDKVRYVFPYDEKVFELDVFGGHLAGLVMLEVELQRRNDPVILPPDWVVEEVTDDKRYKNRQLAVPA